jgi:chromosome segregation ATPase
MKLHFKSKYWLVAIVPVGMTLIGLAWQRTEPGNANNNYNAQDTLPSKSRSKTIKGDNDVRNEKDIDKEMRKLDEALEKLDGKLENIDWEKINKQIESSVKKAQEEMERNHVDMEKIQQEVERSLKDIDVEKIKKETALAMQQVKENIDINKINDEVQKSLETVKEQMNSDAFRKSMEEIKKVDIDQIKKELENVKDEMKKNKVNIKEEIDNAKEDIKKAKEELKGYRDMLDDMEKNNLIDTKEDYSVEYKNGELFINGKKQSQEVLNKYKGYFKKDNTEISKKNGRFNININ